MMDHDILEEHVVCHETIDVEDLTIKWEAHAADIKDSIAVSYINIAVIIVVDLDTIFGLLEVALADLIVDVLIVSIVHVGFVRI